MNSLKDFKCGWKIHNVDIKKGKNSQFLGEITIKASPPIYWLQNKLLQKDDGDGYNDNTKDKPRMPTTMTAIMTTVTTMTKEDNN